MPRHTSISELVAMRAPQILSDERSDAEKQVYSVEAVLLGWKQEPPSTAITTSTWCWPIPMTSLAP
ncbi:MAG: hypothetical protein ACXVJ1_12045 [Candidatus Angelobacter sp.]